MDVDNMSSWISQPDVCRCCLSTSGTWDVTASFIAENGIKEVYSHMLQECFGIALSYLTEWGPSRLVCGLCVGHLRDACSFKKQVLQAEDHFISYSTCRKVSENSDKLEIKIETEAVEHGSRDCFTNDLGTVSDEDNHETTKDTQNIESKSNKSLVNRKKRQKASLKEKRKRKKIDDCDSHTPIAQLARKNTPIYVNNKADNEIDTKMVLSMENELKDNDNTNGILNIGSQHIARKKVLRMSADSHIDNRNLRSNITLVLRNSTILPFKFVNSKYSCLYCNKGYLFFKELKQHVLDLHSNISEKDIISCLKTPKDLIKADVSDIKCKSCEENFKTIDKLIDHLISVHNKIYYKTLGVKPSHGILGFNLISETLKCHVCNQDFRFFKNLSMHMNEHSTNFMCHFCGKKFVSDHRLQTHVLAHKKTDIRCKHCGKEFRTMSMRSYHIRKIHNVSNNYKCPECPEHFSQYQHRLRHLVEKHKLKKPEFRCDVCAKEFASSGGLGAHVRFSHLKNKEYTCNICGKIFVHKWTWQRHLDVHSGVKKFECKFCNKKFGRPYTLDIHTRIHLNDKRFVCSVCKVAFTQKCSLKNHIRVHHTDVDIDLSKL